MIAQPKIKPEILAAWESVVRRLNPLTSPLLPLPEEPRGRYIKYAYDASGRLALPRGRGKRLHPHRKLQNLQRQRDLAYIAQNLFTVALQNKFRAAQEIAAGTSPFTMPPLTMEDVNKLKVWALTKAHEILQTEANNASNAARHRHDVSRRINAGTLAGNNDRAAHARA